MEFGEYLRSCNRYPTSGAVFEKPNGMRYSTSNFLKWLKKVAEACGVSKEKAQTHGLRHRFARNFHSENRSEIMLANAMGHKSIETTRLYTGKTFEEMRNAMQASSNKARANCQLWTYRQSKVAAQAA